MSVVYTHSRLLAEAATRVLTPQAYNASKRWAGGLGRDFRFGRNAQARGNSAGARTVRMSHPSGPRLVKRRLWERFEHEHLDGEVGVDVVVAHKADHLAAGQLFDL